MTGKSNFHFRNWAGNEQCYPQKYFQPQTEEEIARIVKEAADTNRKIRVVGAGHSWSAMACTDDYMVNLDLYSNVLHIDKAKKQIRVQAGIRIKELNNLLEDIGLALINLGSICEQSIAGVTSTGTHGTGINFQILSSSIIGMRVIKANGEAIEIDEAHPQLNAFRVSLGLLGIISEITLQCRGAFNLKEDSEPMLFDEALDRIPELLQQNDHLKFWWFPHGTQLMVYRYHRTMEPRQHPFAFVKWIEEVLVAGYFFALVLRWGNAFPSRIASINRFINRLHLKKIVRIGKSCDILNVPMPPRHRESEYAIPVEKAPEALRELRDEIERNKMKVNFVVEIRFVKGDSMWLSPAYGRDSCYIGGYLYGDKRWPPYLKLFENIMKKYDGRPHWGKEFSLELHDFEKMYPKFDDFMKLRHEVDLNRRFVNRLAEKIISKNY